MNPRQIMITIGVVVAVFAIAFVGAKAGGGSATPEAAAASVGKVIEVPSAAISASVSAQALPTLKAVKKKKPKKVTPPSTNTAPPSTNTAPPSTNTAPPSTNTAPPSTNTAPPSTNTAPPSTNTAPPPSNPNPAPTPVTGGGET